MVYFKFTQSLCFSFLYAFPIWAWFSLTFKKHKRERHWWYLCFFSVPKAVTNLTVSYVEKNSVCLSWEKPEGNVDFYRLTYETTLVKVTTERRKVEGLIPGTPYNFTVVSGVNDASKWSYEAHVSAYTSEFLLILFHVYVCATHVTFISVFLLLVAGSVICDWNQWKAPKSLFTPKRGSGLQFVLSC